MNMWPGLWPGLAWPQAITASGRFRGLGFLTRGLALAWPQAADSGRRRPWLGHDLWQPIDTVYYTSNRYTLIPSNFDFNKYFNT